MNNNYLKAMTEHMESSADNPRTCLKDRVFLCNFEKVLILAPSPLY